MAILFENKLYSSCCVALCIFCVVLCIVCFVTFPVLFVCICVLNNCHRVATQLQLNISYHKRVDCPIHEDKKNMNLNYIYSPSFHLTQKKLPFHCNVSLFILLVQIMPVYCRQQASFCNVKSCDANNNHQKLNG